MPEPTLKEKTAKGLFWGGISNFLQQLIGMAFGIVIARILSPDDYGLVAMLAIFTAIANTIMDSGFTTALINRKTIEHKDYNAVFWFNIFVGVGIYILLFFSAPLIAKFYDQPVLTNLSRLMFLSFVIAGTGIAHNAILVKKIMAKQRGIIDMSAVFCSGLIGLILALNGYAFWGLAIQQVSQTLIAVILRWYFSPWRPTFHFDFSPLREMFGFSVKMLFTNVVLQITANLFSVILGRFYGKKETGYYAQGNKWAGIGILSISSAFVNLALPVLVEAKGDKKRQLNVFRKLMRFGSFIVFPTMLLLAFVGKEFIIITLGSKWVESTIFLQLFCLMWGSIYFIWILYTNLLLSYGKSDVYMWGMISICVLQLSCVYYMFPWGIVPMVIVYLSIYLFGLLFWHYNANKLIGIRLWDVFMDVFPYFAISCVSILCAWGLSYRIENIYLGIVIKVLTTITVYVSVMYLSNSVMFKDCCKFIVNSYKKNS